jgi:hypothetical protein
MRDVCRPHYRSITSSGWSKCPLGYAVYCQYIDDGEICIFPGLNINGISTRHGKSEGVSIVLDRDVFERHITSIIDLLEHYSNIQANTELGLIHEIKAINAILYNTSARLRTEIEKYNLPNLLSSLSIDIVNQSRILSVRTDFEQVKFAPEIAENIEIIPVYKVFDKVVRTFISRARKTNNALSIAGESYGSVRGPKIIEIIPFLAIENAIKYSPQGYPISVLITEDSDIIYCTFCSVGPKVEYYELDKIFRPRYRGKNVVAQAGGLLEFQIGGGLAHALLEIGR